MNGAVSSPNAAIHADQRLSRCASQSDVNEPMRSPIPIESPEIVPNNAPASRGGNSCTRARNTASQFDTDVMPKPASPPPMITNPSAGRANSCRKAAPKSGGGAGDFGALSDSPRGGSRSTNQTNSAAMSPGSPSVKNAARQPQ